ncbi:hypothetical protein EB118_19915 [bacterium]|nr:hypothetical protein [bacterium]NDC95765.1 hypothetical protein [bacterium]NDD85432.1 hypothetical protein [bacterium]NDG32329.1 hypothetical protein [bacterium]
MAVLYRHIRLDKNEPFYIGIGKTEKRAYSNKIRNKHWHNIVNKTGYKVQIMFDDLTWDEACEKEKEFIALYGRKEFGGMLCNMTDGGEGVINMSKETRQKLSEFNKGKTHSAETLAKISAASKGENNPNFGKIHSTETKAKISAAGKGNKRNLGKTHSAETKQKMSEAKKGKTHSAETLAKISAALTGNKHNLGKRKNK